MERRGRGRTSRRSFLDFRLLLPLFSGSTRQRAGHLSREHRESPGREGVQLRRDPSRQPLPLHLQRAWIGRFSLCDGGARFDGHLRSRPGLTLRIRPFAPAPAFPLLRTEEAKFTAYTVMTCRILSPCCGTKFLICGLRGAMPQNGTSLAALNPLIHIIDF